MVKKYANAMTPHLVYVNHQFMWEPLSTPMDVLVLAKRLLLLGLLFCFGYALLLFIQGLLAQRKQSNTNDPIGARTLVRT